LREIAGILIMSMTDRSVNWAIIGASHYQKAFYMGQNMVKTGANHSEQMREAILSAAEQVFDASGYSAATMEAVAREAGIAKGSIYNYFESKQDLFRQLYDSVVSVTMSDVAADLGKAKSAAEKLSRLLDFRFGRLAHMHRIGRLVLEFYAVAARQSGDREIAALHVEHYKAVRDLIESVLQHGIRDGEFRTEIDVPTGAKLILGMLDGILVQSIFQVGLTIDESFVSSLKKTILTGLTDGTRDGHSERDGTYSGEAI